MRKRFFLTGAFVCLLISNLALAQSPASSTAKSADFSSDSAEVRETNSATVANLSSSQLLEKIAEAKQIMKSQPALTNAESGTAVTLAALDPETSQIHLLTVAKDTFLTSGANLLLRSQLGRMLRLLVVNPNGVNTAVTVADPSSGQRLLPLTVRYPIERDGAITEIAYYTSGHPAMRTPDVISSGEAYVATMLDQAASRLAEKGVLIAPDIVSVARHLVIVEHTDHKRFKNDDPAVYPEVLSLYALNQGNTFRYSVSSAGAGGMIQMIPRTYEAIREHHPNVALDADFVSGMQNHANALKAMLLYINDTWNYLKQTTEVQQALQSGTATKTELLAAGYNSNPYKLPSYLSNGGSAWRSLIPAETQMYLAIYQSVDANVEFASVNSAANDVASGRLPAVARVATAALVASVGSMLD
ncbi:MAG TPA: hypothetical protein VGJ69_11310 [Pyrinomonadaceae bacterium]